MSGYAKVVRGRTGDNLIKIEAVVVVETGLAVLPLIANGRLPSSSSR